MMLRAYVFIKNKSCKQEKNLFLINYLSKTCMKNM